MFTLFIIQIRHGVTIFIMVPTYNVMNHFFFNRPNFFKKNLVSYNNSPGVIVTDKRYSFWF